jgi:DNA-binding MarR family transcriptional regulator
VIGKIPPNERDVPLDPADPGAVANQLMAWIGLSMKKSRNMEGLKLLSDLGMTVPQTVALHMCAFEDDVTMTTLVERLGLSPSAVSSMVQRMVELDLVTRSEDERDRRQKLVRVTDTGRAFIQRLMVSRYEDLRASLEPLSETTRADLFHVLARMLDEIAPGFSDLRGTEHACSASVPMQFSTGPTAATSAAGTSEVGPSEPPESSLPKKGET